MKILVLSILTLFFTLDVTAQVIFRNDFVIRKNKIKNVGLSTISINTGGRSTNWNQLINGRGGKTLVIDLLALRRKKTQFTYTEIAEKIYTPPVFTGPITQRVPVFLLTGPPNLQHQVYNSSLDNNYLFRRLTFSPLLNNF